MDDKLAHAAATHHNVLHDTDLPVSSNSSSTRAGKNVTNVITMDYNSVLSVVDFLYTKDVSAAAPSQGD